MLKVTSASALLLFAIAGTAIANDDPVNLPLKQLTVAPPGTHFAPRSEVNQLVFEVPSPSDVPGGNVGTGGSAAVVKDGNFPTFPPAQGVTYPIVANAFAFGWIAFGTANPGNFDIQYTFFDTVDMTVDAAAPFYSTQLGGFRLNNVAPIWGFIQWFQDPIVFGDVSFPDQNWAYEVKLFDTGTEVLWTGANHGGAAPTSVNQMVPCGRVPAPGVGSSGVTYHFDDAATQDTSLGLDQTILNNAAHTRGSAAAPRYIYLKIRADIPPVPAPGAIDLTTGLAVVGTPVALDCNVAGTVSQTFEMAPGQVQLFGFTLGPSGATSAANTFVDITTSTDFADTSMALYDVAGNRIKIDEDSGELLNPALTFGHGRRPAVGDSIQFDGHHGDLIAGTYYIAVGGFGTTYGSSGFTVNGASSIESGNVTVTVTHNTSAVGIDCLLPDPVAPNATPVGLLPAGVTTVAVGEVGFGELRWLTFSTDYPIDPGNPGNFLDITTAGSDPNVVDSELGVFDSTGNLIAENDDGCGDFVNSPLSVISFGDPNVTARPGIGTCQATGQSGATLAAGDYYLSVGLFDVSYGATGWEARSDSGSRLTVNVNFRTPSGCPADFNADGNVDPDDLSDFITCFFLDVLIPGSCPASDFNGDGFRDPDDLSDFITAFFTNVC